MTNIVKSYSSSRPFSVKFVIHKMDLSSSLSLTIETALHSDEFIRIELWKKHKKHIFIQKYISKFPLIFEKWPLDNTEMILKGYNDVKYIKCQFVLIIMDLQY